MSGKKTAWQLREEAKKKAWEKQPKRNSKFRDYDKISAGEKRMDRESIRRSSVVSRQSVAKKVATQLMTDLSGMQDFDKILAEMREEDEDNYQCKAMMSFSSLMHEIDEEDEEEEEEEDEEEKEEQKPEPEPEPAAAPPTTTRPRPRGAKGVKSTPQRNKSTDPSLMRRNKAKKAGTSPVKTTATEEESKEAEVQIEEEKEQVKREEVKEEMEQPTQSTTGRKSKVRISMKVTLKGILRNPNRPKRVKNLKFPEEDEDIVQVFFIEDLTKRDTTWGDIWDDLYFDEETMAEFKYEAFMEQVQLEEYGMSMDDMEDSGGFTEYDINEILESYNQ